MASTSNAENLVKIAVFLKTRIRGKWLIFANQVTYTTTTKNNAVMTFLGCGCMRCHPYTRYIQIYVAQVDQPPITPYPASIAGWSHALTYVPRERHSSHPTSSEQEMLQYSTKGYSVYSVVMIVTREQCDPLIINDVNKTDWDSRTTPIWMYLVKMGLPLYHNNTSGYRQRTPSGKRFMSKQQYKASSELMYV